MPNKYGAVKTEIMFKGKLTAFASVREARRAKELEMLEKAGAIKSLELQPRFELVPKLPGENAAYYTADFRYKENGKIIVEEVKSEITRKKADYILRRKLFKWRNPQLIFREVL